MKNEATENSLYKMYTSTATGLKDNEETWLAHSARYFRARYRKLLPEDRQAQILDLGCGHGRYVKTLHDMGYENVDGVDLSEEQVTYAREKLGLVRVHEADATQFLSEKRDVYDCILVLDVLEHLDVDSLIALGKNLNSALKRNGKLIIQVPSGTSPMNPVVFGDLTHTRAFTPHSLRQFLLNVGFEASTVLELPPVVHDLQSFVRRAIWEVLRPVIRVIGLVLHGDPARSSIYTSNFACIARKSR